MTINYLDIRRGPFAVLSGRDEGCGCCSDRLDATNKADALKLLADWETELKERLAKVKSLRLQVKKWKR